MDKIIVAVDLSDVATVALDHTVSFAKAFKSHVRILHVEVPIPTYIGNEIVQPVIPTDNEEEMERISKDLSAMVDHLKQRGVEADYELIKGPIVESIIEKAASYNADMIILGAHNHGFLYRAFIGSVCSGVVKHSPCPVLIIPSK
jgi:nucleotide-binding universal stress UspA family protein